MEIRLLHKNKLSCYIFGAMSGMTFPGLGIMFLFYGGSTGFILLFGFLAGGIAISMIFFREGRKAYKDEQNGKAEIIRGKITKKEPGGKGPAYIEIGGRYVPSEIAFWKSVNIGDPIYLELAPYSNEIFKIKKG
jgi:hypothetical protein